jgi:hypothetical protein
MRISLPDETPLHLSLFPLLLLLFLAGRRVAFFLYSFPVS